MKNPDRWFAREGKNGIGGHLNRINRYAQQHYANDYLTVIPVMLLAAQLAQEPELKNYSKQLFKTSRIQDFLDSIRESLIDYGAIRRSQTLLGSTVGSIDTPHKWITQQAVAYNTLAMQLQEKRRNINQQLKRAEKDHRNELQQKIREIFQTAFNQVTPFAEEHWETNEYQMNNCWKEALKRLVFEKRLKAAAENASQHFKNEVQEAIEEIGNELKIINQLENSSFQFSKQDSGFFDKDFVRIMGMMMFAAGAFLAFVFPPLGLLSVAGGAASWLAGLFKSRDQKRHEAVEAISTSLRRQLDEQQEKVLRHSRENLAWFINGHFWVTLAAQFRPSSPMTRY